MSSLVVGGIAIAPVWCRGAIFKTFTGDKLGIVRKGEHWRGVSQVFDRLGAVGNIKTLDTQKAFAGDY